MVETRQTSWGEGELREALCLMMIGVCAWIAGTQLGLFGVFLTFTTFHHLNDLLMLGVCMSFGLVVASVRKSLTLRRVMIARDAARDRAELAARHDALTGLANRRLFKETLDERLSRAGPPTIAVLLIDLDRFKPVNDVYGHAAGDAVLFAAAERMRALNPPGGMTARLGGDEFAVMFDYGSDSDAVPRFTQQLIASLSKPVDWDRSRIEIGATVGIALATANHSDSVSLLHAADVAMYKGKRDGRGTFRFFQEEMGHAIKLRARMEAELRLGIGRGEIEPFYQPVVQLPSRELIGFEVLARWRHPERGLLGPMEFIGLAEETGLIAELSWAVMRKACTDARSWPGHLLLAINISPLQLQDRLLPERILAILTETGFAPGRLEIEITETALVNDLEAARVALKSLQNFGVRIALDDFGTGYSSLYHLRELQFDKLKIDRSYVASIPLGEDRAKLVDAIIALGSSLGLATTAEGIENSSSVDWLADQGCAYGQGFLFGKPVNKETTDGLLALWSDIAGKIVLTDSETAPSDQTNPTAAAA